MQFLPPPAAAIPGAVPPTMATCIIELLAGQPKSAAMRPPYRLYRGGANWTAKWSLRSKLSSFTAVI